MSTWQCCECQQVVDSRLVVQRWRKLSNQKPIYTTTPFCSSSRLSSSSSSSSGIFAWRTQNRESTSVAVEILPVRCLVDTVLLEDCSRAGVQQQRSFCHRVACLFSFTQPSKYCGAALRLIRVLSVCPSPYGLITRKNKGLEKPKLVCQYSVQKIRRR